MPAATLNLTDSLRLEQGASWWLTMHWTDANGTIRDLSAGWSARMQFRKSATDSSILCSATSAADDGITLTDGAELVLDAWATGIAYHVGDLIKPTVANGYKYRCTTAGISGATEPTWPTTSGETVTDGTAVWEFYGLSKNPNIQIYLPAAKTDGLTYEKVFYDLELVEAATTYVYRVVEGYAVNKLNVTR